MSTFIKIGASTYDSADYEIPLADLDTAYMKALETSADTTQIIADKQALRDAPSLSSISSASTVDELKAIQPVPNVTIE